MASASIQDGETDQIYPCTRNNWKMGKLLQEMVVCKTLDISHWRQWSWEGKMSWATQLPSICLGWASRLWHREADSGRAAGSLSWKDGTGHRDTGHLPCGESNEEKTPEIYRGRSPSSLYLRTDQHVPVRKASEADKEARGRTEVDSAWHSHRACPTSQPGKLPDSQNQVKYPEGSCLTSRELVLDWALLWSHLRNLRSKTKNIKMFPSNITTFHSRAQDHCVNTKIFSTQREKFSL